MHEREHFQDTNIFSLQIETVFGQEDCSPSHALLEWKYPEKKKQTQMSSSSWVFFSSSKSQVIDAHSWLFASVVYLRVNKSTIIRWVQNSIHCTRLSSSTSKSRMKTHTEMCFQVVFQERLSFLSLFLWLNSLSSLLSSRLANKADEEMTIQPIFPSLTVMLLSAVLSCIRHVYWPCCVLFFYLFSSKIRTSISKSKEDQSRKDEGWRKETSNGIHGWTTGSTQTGIPGEQVSVIIMPFIICHSLSKRDDKIVCCRL